MKKKTVKIEPDGQFHLIAKFNDQTFDKQTDDLVSAIQEIKPKVLKTKAVFVIKDRDTDKVAEKMLWGFRAKQLFRNPLSLRMFVRRLIFK